MLKRVAPNIYIKAILKSIKRIKCHTLRLSQFKDIYLKRFCGQQNTLQMCTAIYLHFSLLATAELFAVSIAFGTFRYS